MKTRARASRWGSMASDTFRSPHDPCPLSNAQLRRSLHDFAATLARDRPPRGARLGPDELGCAIPPGMAAGVLGYVRAGGQTGPDADLAAEEWPVVHPVAAEDTSADGGTVPLQQKAHA